MPYFARRRRVIRKRSTRGTLSTRRIYGSTSARNQARQISALNKRIAYVQRQCRPEYKLFSGTNESYSFNSGAIGSTYKIVTFNGPLVGTSDSTFIGNKVRSIALNLYFTGEYHNSSQTGYHDSESSGTPFRIVVLQRKQPSNSSVGIDEILSASAGSGADYTMQAVAPLKRGITENFKVLKDYKFTFTSARNQKIQQKHLKFHQYLRMSYWVVYVAKQRF